MNIIPVNWKKKRTTTKIKTYFTRISAIIFDHQMILFVLWLVKPVLKIRFAIYNHFDTDQKASRDLNETIIVSKNSSSTFSADILFLFSDEFRSSHVNAKSREEWGERESGAAMMRRSMFEVKRCKSVFGVHIFSFRFNFLLPFCGAAHFSHGFRAFIIQTSKRNALECCLLLFGLSSTISPNLSTPEMFFRSLHSCVHLLSC